MVFRRCKQQQQQQEEEMSMGLGTPINQVRLTNVAYVRLRKNNKRFEIACYRNKVLNYRTKIETDLSEVLQIDSVFTNVSKGLLASAKDLMETFGTSDTNTVCRIILEKGELQVSEEERASLYDSTFRDIASLVADKAVNPDNNRPYTVSMIQNAMKQIHYSVNVSKSTKSQALDVIKRLKSVMPIARAAMLLRIIFPLIHYELVESYFHKELNIEVPSVDKSTIANDNITWDMKVDPDMFRKVEEAIQKQTKSEGRVEVLQLRVSNTGDTSKSVISHVKDPAAAITTDDNNEIPKNQTKKEKLKPLKSENDSALLSSLLQGGMSLAVDSDDDEQDGADSEGEIVAFGMVKKKTKSKPKTKSNTHKNSDDDDDDDDDDDVVEGGSDALDSKGQNKEAIGILLSKGKKEGNEMAEVKNKKGKKTKRLEKEEKIEKDNRTKKLQERLELEQQRLQVEIANQTLPPPVENNTSIVSPPNAPTATITASSKCNTCGGQFPDAASYRSHFKSEWHRCNLNRKMKNLPIISSEAEFNELTLSGAI